MDEQKLIRRKKKALNAGNRKAIAEACNDLAAFYSKQSRYEEAKEEYKHEASVYKEMGLELEWGRCNRMVGEMYTLMAEFDAALQYEECHLNVARELKNELEEQRAMATLGRIYLLQGQSSADPEVSTTSLKAAEKAFMKSLVLCESLKGKINTHEIMDMRARLLLNIGVALEHLGMFNKAIGFMQKAISICSSQDLFENLHQCHMAQGFLYLGKMDDFSMALICFNKALEVAGRLEDKVLKQCESLSAKADVLCRMSDYQSAKQVLHKAWKLNTPDLQEKKTIENNLKIVATICYAENSIISTKSTDHDSLKRLYETLGDAACLLQNYGNAAEYYLKMLEQAELTGDSGKLLLPIYVSLYQTFNDMGRYEEALKYYYIEYDLIQDIPKEAYTTLLNIAEAMHQAKKPYQQIEDICLKAKIEAQKRSSKKYEVNVLKRLLKYQQEHLQIEEMDETKKQLKEFGYDIDESLELSDEDDESSDGGSQPTKENTTNIGDDICLEDITDSDISDKEEADLKIHVREIRRRGRGFNVKKNMKGETQLHLACISGNKTLVERLLSRGHPVNLRDNAGWLPLHEACIHGHLDVTDLLLKHGANINDRGGSQCDGITPLYDAASNGHLEIVKLLIDRGAIPGLKTDFGETPLHVLQKWRTGNILNKADEYLYKQICNKIHSHIDKTGASTDTALLRAESTTCTSPPITSKSPLKKLQNNSYETNRKDVPIFRNRNVIEKDDDEDEIKKVKETPKFQLDDESSNSSSENIINIKKNKNNSVKEYKNAILAIRKKTLSDDFDIHRSVKKTKPALLHSEEVEVDDWLEDDLTDTKTKKRKRSDSVTIIANETKLRKSNDSCDSSKRDNIITSDKINNSNSDHSLSMTKARLSNIIDSDSSDSSDSFNMRENINPSPNVRSSDENTFKNITKSFSNSLSNDDSLTDSRQKMNKRWKRQSTLFKAGFQRKKSPDQNSDCSRTSCNSDNESIFINNYTSRTEDQFINQIKQPQSFSDINGSHMPQNRTNSILRQNVTPINIMQPMNMIRPISIVQSKNGKSTKTQILPPATVRVKVEDKTLLIPLKLNTINNLNISWLVDEVKARYFKICGVRPVFSLMTQDGALLSEDDPLSLVLGSPELNTAITHWKASPAEERYLECCDALNIATSQEIQDSIGRSHMTHRLALPVKTLSTKQIRPLFRALTHQSHLTSITVSDNDIGDDGLKYLTDCLPTLKNISHIDISNNLITAEGVKMLKRVFEKASRPVCQCLEQITLSGNMISDDGFITLLSISNFVKFKVLRVSNCNITEAAMSQIIETDLSLDHVEVLEINNNDMKQNTLTALVNKLNPNVITELELENVGIDGKVAGLLSTFLDKATNIKLKKLNLSKCSLVDAQFMRLFRCLSRARVLQTLTLQDNLLTFIALKKLLQRQPPLPQLNLQHCADIFKFARDSDFQSWLPAINFGCCVPELNLTPTPKNDEERESITKFMKTWLSCFKGRGSVEHSDSSVVKFTCR